jgi:hypothetical protein
MMVSLNWCALDREVETKDPLAVRMTYLSVVRRG